jgi:DNA-binding GntR family transcriptional regulator
MQNAHRRGRTQPRREPDPRLDRRGARPEQVYQQLRDLIVRGQIAPGSRVVETDVAERLGVSRTPVRSALHRLQQEGYIIDTPALRQSRPTVAPLTRDDMHELFHIVGEIEGLGAFFAAQLPSARRAALVDALATTNDAFRLCAERPRPSTTELYDLDERFHRLYMDAAARPRLLALHAAVKPQAERYERIYVTFLSGEIGTSVAEHKAICRAIKAGDAEAAQRAVETNWRNAAARLDGVIDTMGERGRW